MRPRGEFGGVAIATGALQNVLRRSKATDLGVAPIGLVPHDLDDGVFGEERHHVLETTTIAERVVARGEVADLLTGLRFPVFHGAFRASFPVPKSASAIRVATSF